MPREIHDHYFRKAKSEGYRSRAAYKLIEIDDRKKLLKPGRLVLDAGCAPGSWLQVAARRVAPSHEGRGRMSGGGDSSGGGGRHVSGGLVVGIDLRPVSPNFSEPDIRLLQGDFATIPADRLLAPIRDHADRPDARYDLVLSDMAPSTTGDRTIDHHASIRLAHAILDRCPELLAQQGDIVIKVFEGEAYPALLRRAKAMFRRVKGFKPAASRDESTEIYLVAHEFTGTSAPRPSNNDDDALAARPGDEDAAAAAAMQLPKRRPSTGWNTPAS